MSPRPNECTEALNALSAPSVGPADMNRRRFLQLVGMGVGAGLSGHALVEAVGAYLPDFDPLALAASPLAADDGVLVIVGMYGGNDGANTVVRFNDGNYYAQRGRLAIPGDQTLRLDGQRGLNPNLAAVKKFWDAKQLAVIEGVGYPDPDFSHFTSQAIWMSAVARGIRTTGWIGRWLDEQYGSERSPLASATVGRSVPLHMIGRHQRAASIGYTGFNFGGSIESWDLRMYGAVNSMARSAGRGALHDRYTATLRDQIGVGSRVKPFMPDEIDAPEIVAKLDVAARLVNADLGLRVVDVGWHNFDQHADQPGAHQGLLRDFDAGVERFFSTLSPEWANRVTVMTFSEFGRTPFGNDSNGTDHGSASCALVLGANVKGGFYGAHPKLAGLKRWDRPDHRVDFRSYYASILDGWLGGGSATVLGKQYENLGLFERGPGSGNERPPFIGAKPPSPPTGRFVPITPTRILDSRDGTGDVLHRRIGANEVIRVPVAGRAGIPATGVTAVVANVTAVGASDPTYFTLTPSGQRMPDASTLNPKVGGVVANCTVMALGVNGAIDVLNRYGTSDFIIDVFGYLTPDAGDALNTVKPARLLDTRDGTGGVTGPVRVRQRIDLQVTGRGGVPASGVTAVVMNVTVTQPSSPGYLVSGASGRPLPSTSNVNFFPGDTVPNLVFCAVGRDGKVSLGAVCDGAHVIADVFGWFGSTGNKIKAVRPQRILDTRIGLGAPQRQLGAIHTVRLQVANRDPVPKGATAALLNVTATNARRGLFVTVWPSGSKQPGTSNLNVPEGGTVANLVLCELGPDGQLDFASPVSHVDVIADVVGYVAP